MGSWFDRIFGRDADSPAPESSAPKAVTTRPPEPLDRDAIVELLGLKLAPAVVAEPEAALVERVRELFKQTNPVPGSPPQLAMRILNLVAQADADAAELAKLISLEPALTAAVLRVANSAAYRTIGRIESVRDAITRLGMREVARIGCALSAKSVFDPQRRAEQTLFGPIFLELFVHASATALASATLSVQIPRLKNASDLIFLGGLLHDLGKAVALRVLAAVLSGEPGRRALSTDEVHALLELVHVEIGAQLHREWRLPESSLAICAAHHPGSAPDSAFFAETHAVRLTSALHLLRARPPTEARLAEVDESARVLGLTRYQLSSFDADVGRFREMAQELGS